MAQARKLSGAKDETEAVRIALEQLIERAKFRAWVDRAAGAAPFAGLDE